MRCPECGSDSWSITNYGQGADPPDHYGECSKCKHTEHYGWNHPETPTPSAGSSNPGCFIIVLCLAACVIYALLHAFFSK